MTATETMQEVIDRRELEISNMCFRHPWFNYLYNWIVFLTVIGLCSSIFWWGIDIRTDRIASAQAEIARQEVYAEHQAQAEAVALAAQAEAQSREARLNSWSTEGAKLLYGLKGFIEQYGYDESDLETYLRCVYNRYLYAGRITSLETIISTKDQFTGYNASNPVLDKYYIFCLKLFTAWDGEERLPCDPSYRFAELTKQGIYLKADFEADGYAPRWHA